MLSKEEQAKWVARLPSKKAQNALVEGNMAFIVSIAQKYHGYGLPIEDLVAEGVRGAIRAAQKFNPALGNLFITYAVSWIRQTIVLAIHKDRTVRIPENRFDNGGYRGWLGMEDDDEESYDVSATPTVWPEAMSLNSKICTTGGDELIDMWADTTSPDAYEVVETADRREKVRELLDYLPVREAEILSLYFGLDGEEELTLEQVGLRFGITRERVRQIKEKALEKLLPKARKVFA